MFEQPSYPHQPSFSRGEVSPDLFGRVDLQAYGSGLRTSRNAFIRTEGAWCNRQGTQFIGNAVNTTPKGSVLIPFIFSTTQTYLIEVGVGSAQVFSQGETVTVAGPAISNINLTGTLVGSQILYTTNITTASPHGLLPGQNVTLSGIVGLGAFNINGSWVVAGTPNATKFTIMTGLGSTGTWVSGGAISSPLMIATPYALADLPALRYTQSADTLTIMHQKYPAYEFKRTSASTFTFLPGVYNNGPFIPQNTDGTTLVYASAISGTVTLTASAPIFKSTHVGGLFYLEQQDVAPIVPWTPDTVLTAPIGMLVSSNLKNYKCVAVPTTGAWATGPVAPDHTFGIEWDGSGQTVANLANVVGLPWEFQDFGYGVVLITEYLSATQVMGVVQPVITGQPALLPAMVVGPNTVAFGPFNFTGDGTTVAFTPLTSISSTDPSKFEVTVDRIYVQPPNYTVSGTTITFNVAPANGKAIVVKQVNGLYATSFWAFGAFSPEQGYPGTGTYFPDRLIFAGTPLQPVGVFASQTSNYHNFATSEPVVNSDAFTVFLNARQLNAICDLIPLQDLIVGTSNIIWRLWPGSTGTALGPLAVDATPQAFVGETNSCAAVLYGDSVIYSIYGGRRIRDLIYQFQFDKYVGSELTAYSRHLVPYGTTIVKMVYAPDPWGQLFVLRSDGMLLTCTYVRDQQMIAWSRWDTQGTFEDIAIVPENNSYALYVLANRTVGNQTVRYVERLSQWEWLSIYDYKFSDCSLTYDGRNTSATVMTVTGGTNWIAGDTGTLRASSTAGWANFLSTDPDNKNVIQLFDSTGQLSRMLITDFVSATQVAVRFMDPVPATLRGLGTQTWTFARTTFGGCNQLAGQAVAVLSDSNAVCGLDGTPSIIVGGDGSVTLPNAGGVVTVGLQYFADFENLPLNEAGIETIRERSKSIPMVYLDVHATRGLLVGSSFDKLSPFKQRAFEPYLTSTVLQEGIIEAQIASEFDAECHVCVRQPYPLPVTLRMLIPSLNIGEPIG